MSGGRDAEFLSAPFPYFGGKGSVADVVWNALGDVKHYIEPFFGSGAMLLKRPDYHQRFHVETVCDKDGHIANVWRAMQADPDAVAQVCDWPVNHADLTARRNFLNENAPTMLGNLLADHGYYDVKMAGYWIWAASCWIGNGLVCPNQRPLVAQSGRGVHKLSQIPAVAHSGRGVQDPYNDNIYAWFRALAERLRYVRVVCGDWTRVCGGNWQDDIGVCGIFFDPPYGEAATRKPGLYTTDSLTVADDVRVWCLDRGDKPKMRICLAGYYEEHEDLLEHGWTAHRWATRGGYGNQSGQGNDNRKRETLFMSPHCVENSELLLFAEEEA